MKHLLTPLFFLMVTICQAQSLLPDPSFMYGQWFGTGSSVQSQCNQGICYDLQLDRYEYMSTSIAGSTSSNLVDLCVDVSISSFDHTRTKIILHDGEFNPDSTYAFTIEPGFKTYSHNGGRIQYSIIVAWLQQYQYLTLYNGGDAINYHQVDLGVGITCSTVTSVPVPGGASTNREVEIYPGIWWDGKRKYVK